MDHLFDPDDLAKQVFEARYSKLSADSEPWLSAEIEEQRRSGIRVVLETRERERPGAMDERVRALFHPDLGAQVTRLFATSEERDRLSDSLDLANFWMLKIDGLSMLEMRQNPFDLGYYLQDRLGLRSSEPDIPYTGNIGGGSAPPSPLVGSPVLDRAWSLRAMRVPEAWDHSVRSGMPAYGDGVMVGHPDTGYSDHDDLDRSRLNTTLGWDFVSGQANPKDPLNYSYGSPGHGTATGSVILSEGTVLPPPTSGEGGTGGPGKVTGVAPLATLVPIRTVSKVWWVFTSDLARAIYHARVKGCHVVSMSLGGRGFRSLLAAVLDAVRHDVILVAAAGNYFPIVVWPARYDACIAMAAVNFADRPWNGSSCGPEVDMSAPGENVWRARRVSVADPTTDVGPSSGTSYATANCAGVAALWLAHFGRGALRNAAAAQGVTLQDMYRSALVASAHHPAAWNPSMFGEGVIDAEALLRLPVPPPMVSSRYAAPHPASLSELQRGQGEIDLRQAEYLIDPEGRLAGTHVLADLFGVEPSGLEEKFLRWGSEVVTLLFDLRCENHPALATWWGRDRVDTAVKSIRQALCRRASQALRAELGCN